MANGTKQVINIGNQPNDGTGDNIRTAFEKTNENFELLFAAAGLGSGLRFTNLEDAPDQLTPARLIVTDSIGLTLTQVSLVGGSGIAMTYDYVNGQYIINNTRSTLSTDPTPTLGGNLNATSTNGSDGYRGINFSNPINDRDLVTQKWVYDNFLNRDGNYVSSPGSPLPSTTTAEGSTIRRNVRIALSSANTSTNVGKKIVVYNAAGSTTTVDVSQQGIRPEHITRKDYVDTKISLQGTNTIDPATGLVNPGFGKMTGALELFRDPMDTDSPLTAATRNYVDNNGYWSSNNLYVTMKGRDFQPEVPAYKRGRFYQYAFATLNKAAQYAEKLIEVSQIQVGDYARLITFDNGTAATVDTIDDNYLGSGLARMILDTNNLGSDQFGAAEVGKYTIFPGQYVQGVESNAIALITNIEKTVGGDDLYTLEYVDYGKGFDTNITVSTVAGQSQQRLLTFVDTEQVPIPDFWIGQRFWHEISGALGTIVDISSTADVAGFYYSTFTVEFDSGPIPANNTTINAVDWQVYAADFIVGETVVYNTDVSALQISFIIESGEYYEQYPIKLPANTSIRGDEFRRVIIRPKPGISASPWSDTFFRRDTQIDGMQIAQLNTATNYANSGTLALASVTPSGSTGEAIFALSTGSLLSSYVGFVFQGNDGQGVVKSITGGSFVVDIGTNLSTTATIAAGSWNLYEPVNFGFHYLRDPKKPMNVFTTVTNIGSLINAANSLEINKEFLQTETVAWMNQQQANPASPLFGENFDDVRCANDAGTLVDGFIKDFREGRAGYTINNADKISKTPSLTTGDYGLVVGYLGSISKQVIANTTVSSVSGALQDINPLRTPEAAASAVLTDLVQAAVKIINLNPAFNPPKDNADMDVFLCNDANVIRYVSCQNHGGFMMVLDPTGQVKNKSPYAQTNSSFSQSIAKQAFRGGMFVDGFAGNARVTPTTSTFVNPLSVTVKGLIRKPQVPTFFVKKGIRYEANYFSNYTPDVVLPNGVQTYSATLNLNPLTPGGIPNTVTVATSGALNGYKANSNIPIVVSAPTGVGGVNATGYAVTNSTGRISSVVVDFPGTGYINTPTISVGGAVITNLQITPGGNVSGLSVAFGGEGYTTNTVITISAVGQAGVTAVQANVTAVDANGSIQSVSIVNSGTNWSSDYTYSVQYGSATFNVPAPRAGFIDRINVDPLTGQLEQLELITAGNRSMLANDFTQVNDLGYGIFVTNGGFAENVSMFTYYCYRSYYCLNGAQVRSTTGSSCYGEYGLCAEGSDPNEVPVSVKLSSPLTQVASSYAEYPTYPAIAGQTFVYVTVDPANGGYPALGLSEIEINHNGVIKRYSIGSASPVQESGQPVLKDGKPLYLLSFNSGSLDIAVANLGLYTEITTGTPVTIRAKGLNKFYGINPESLSRSTTSLIMRDDPTSVYHVTGYSAVQSDNAVFIYTLEDYNYISIQAIDQGLTYPILSSTGSGYVSAPTITVTPNTNATIVTKSIFGDQGAVNAGVEALTLNNVNNLIVSQSVTGTNIVSGTIVTFINTATNQVGLSSPTAGLITSSTVLTFTGTAPTFNVSVAGGSISNIEVTSGGTAWSTSTVTLGFSGGTASFQNPTKIAGVIGSTTIKVTPLSNSQENRIFAGLSSSPAYYYQFAINGQLFNITGYRPTRVTKQTWAEVDIDKPLTTAVDSGSTLYAGISIAGSQGSIYSKLSLLRVTGHDFVDIGTGGYATTRIPNDLYGPPIKGPFPTQEVVETGPARVFYATTDQDGNFRVGTAFLVDQAKGSVSINAPIALNNLSSISLKRDLGPPIIEFSTDPTMSADTDEKVPTEHAVVGYLDRRLGITKDGIPSSSVLGGGVLPRNGSLGMLGNLNVGNNNISNLLTPRTGFSGDAANKSYTDNRIERRGTAAKDTDGTTDVPDWGRMTGPLQLVGDPSDPFTTTNAVITPIGSRTIFLTSAPGTYLGLQISGTNIPTGSIITATNSISSPQTVTIWPSAVATAVNSGTILTLEPVIQAVTKRYVDRKGQFTQMREVSLTSPQDQDLLMFNNVVLQPQGATTTSPAVYNTATQIVNVRNNTATITNTASSSGGGSDITITRSNNTATFKLIGGQGANNPITDHHINNSAAIAQSKLAMKKADTSAASSGLQSDLGLAQFNNVEFSAANGWISLLSSTNSTTGIAPSKLQQVSGATGGFLGRTTAGAVDYQTSGTIRTWLQVLGLEGGAINGNLTVSGTAGFGTASPATVLHVAGTSITAVARIQNTSAGASTFDGSGSGLELLANGMNLTSKYTPAIKFGSTDAQFTTTNPKFGAAITAEAAQSYSTDTTGGMDLAFWTSPTSPGTGSGLVEHMRIDSAGNIGIGLTNPTSKLHVSGDVRISGVTTVTNTTLATSTVTGALQVAGGVGIRGDVYALDIYSNGSKVVTESTVPASGVTSFSAGTTGFSPSAATSGTVTLSGVLNAANGGTGIAGTITGIAYANGTGDYTAATAAQVTATIGATFVRNANFATTATNAFQATNATNATNADSVTNGVYTDQTYQNPSFINTLSGSKIIGNITGNSNNITAFTVNQNVGSGNAPTFTGATLSGLTGYLYGNGASALTASTTIPGSAITGNARLGIVTATTFSAAAASNISIGGGSNGQFLQTNGSGSLSWATVDSSVTITNGTGITGGGSGNSFTLGVTNPVLRNVTSGYTGGGQVNISASAPGGTPNIGDIWFDVSASAYTQSLTMPGWTKLPNGLLLQWAAVFVNADSVSSTQPFPTTFSTTISIYVSRYAGFTTGGGGNFGAYFSGSGFQVNNGEDAGSTFYVLAIGTAP
jgi:hypothetical protein